MIEKQLAAVYAALLATEAITETAPVTVRTIYPIAGWVQDWMAKPHSGTAQMPMLAKWEAYLQQRNTLSISLLWAKMQRMLSPVTYIAEKFTSPVPVEKREK